MQHIVSKFRGPWYRLWRPNVLATIDSDALEGCDLSNRDLRGANLRGAGLSHINAAGADLSQADLWARS